MYIPLGQREHASFLAKRERILLNWFCEKLPRTIVPDHLTIVGILGALIAFSGYACSRFNPWFFWLASFGLIVHWLGDSLDGSLARHRNQERVKYGYFLDATTDAFSSLVVMTGLGLSGFVRMDVALLTLATYQMLCICVFLNHHINGIHKLSFLGVGPTEVRLGLIGGNMWIFLHGHAELTTLLGRPLSIYDIVLIANVAISVAVYLRQTMKGFEALSYREAKRPIETVRLRDRAGLADLFVRN